MQKKAANKTNFTGGNRQGDRAILRALMRDGRATNAELSVLANMSESVCFRRVKQMEQDGVIEGYTVRINSASVGLKLAAFVAISLSSQSDDDVVKFEKAVANIPEVLECYLLTGTPDYLLRVAVEDLEALEKLYATALRRLPGVSRFSSNIALKTVVSGNYLPL